MPFAANRTVSDGWEVLMKGGTLGERTGYPRGNDRRFAYCTHENDAEVIVDALNAAEERGELRPDGNLDKAYINVMWDACRRQLESIGGGSYAIVMAGNQPCVKRLNFTEDGVRG